MNSLRSFLSTTIIICGWSSIAGWILALSQDNPYQTKPEQAWWATTFFVFLTIFAMMAWQMLSDLWLFIRWMVPVEPMPEPAPEPEPEPTPEPTPEPGPRIRLRQWGPWVNERLASNTSLIHTYNGHTWTATFHGHDNIQHERDRYSSAHAFAVAHLRKLKTLGRFVGPISTNAWKTVQYTDQTGTHALDTLRS